MTISDRIVTRIAPGAPLGRDVRVNLREACAGTTVRPMPGRAPRAVAATVASMACLVGACATNPSQPADHAASHPTAEFRHHHAEIREHLNHIDAMAASLAAQSAPDQRRTMRQIVTFLKEHIGPHATSEERVLYPTVERQAGGGGGLTAAPVYEHRLVERSIAALEREVAAPTPDAAVFAREALHLMGLLYAHFEVEEEVLLPVLDRTMSSEQFKREVAQKMEE